MSELREMNVVEGLLVMPMDRIIEPLLPARESMDSEAMRELVSSMSEIGLLQPIIVAPCGEYYEVVAGHRRYLAARELHWAGIPVTVFRERGVALEAARAHENLVREDLNSAEEAVWYTQLLEKHKLDEAGLCALVKRSPDYIGDRLRLLRGDPEVFSSVRDGRIGFGVGRELNKITDEGMRRFYLDTAIRSGTSHRVVAGWVAAWKAQAGFTPVAAPAVVGPENSQPPVPYEFRCMLCGGDKDPWNLVTVQMHRWEVDEIHKLMRAGREDELQKVVGSGE